MIEITVPRLGWSMEEGTFSEWLKQDGDWVDQGDMLFVLESDKAAQEIESFEAGVLKIGTTAPKPGEMVKVGQVIGYLVARDEAATFAAPVSEAQSAETGQSGPATPAATLQRASRPEESHVPIDGRRAVASPRARRAASDRGIAWQALAGSGRGGRVREHDVLAAAETHANEKSVAAPVSATRKLIAERMLASVRSTAPVTLTTKVDAVNLVNLRDQFRATSQEESTPSISDIVVKLTARALQSHPEMNARWDDDQIVYLAEINVGLAVDTEAGLVVPAIRDVPKLGLKEVAVLSRRLIEKARGRRLAAHDLSGSTFTVTNLGMYGIDAFTPIINLPETAILGVGTVRREPVVLDDDRIVPGQTLILSLTFDHRVVDGAPAANFLQTLRILIENPAAALVE
jgi:pyruvate dehydrogenase E2 component (dihydrolipoamide acetyltransferase)